VLHFISVMYVDFITLHAKLWRSVL